MAGNVRTPAPRKQAAFRLPPDLRERLGAQAEREDRTVTAVVIRAIRAYLDQHEHEGEPVTAERDSKAKP